MKHHYWFRLSAALIASSFAMVLGTFTSHHAFAQPSADFDLVWDTVDDNGIALNPDWEWWHVHHALLPNPDSACEGFPLSPPVPGVGRPTLGSPPCSSQAVTFDPPGGPYSSLVCEAGAVRDGRTGKFDGHVNWLPVTYTGLLYWEQHSNSVYDDDDYSFRLVPPSNTTLVPGNNGVLEAEFNSDETIDHFHTQWWEVFHDAVDNGDPSLFVEGSEAVVTGRLGIDTQHRLHTEIHPVWALAVHDRFRQDAADDVWAIFVRNWGNQGLCSSQQHYLELQTITLRLPWRDKATSVNAAQGTTFLYGPDDMPQSEKNMVSGPGLAPTANRDGLLVTFTLPPPRAHARINGELHLQWTGVPVDPCQTFRTRLHALQNQLNQLLSGLPANKANIPGVIEHRERAINNWHRAHDQELAELTRRLTDCVNSRFRTSSVVALTAAVQAKRPARNDPSETGLAFLWSRMTEGQKQTFLERLPSREPARRDTLTVRPLTVALPPGVLGVLKPLARTTTETDMRQQNLDRMRFEALNAAFNGNIPRPASAAVAAPAPNPRP